MDWLKEKVIAAAKTAPSEEKLAEYLIKLGQKILSNGADDHSTKTIYDAWGELFDRKQSRFSLRLREKPFEPMSDIFVLSDGLHVIAAPSSHGKSLWAMEWAKQAARDEMTVTFLSLEMSHEDLAARVVSEASHLPLQQIVLNDLSDVQKRVLLDLRESYGFLKNIRVDKFQSLDWPKIEARLFDHMIRDRPKLVIIDFVQMISDSSSDDSRASQQLANIARKLKNFADTSSCAVLLLSQMNREALKEVERGRWQNAVPLHHGFIRESGGIVEAADTVQVVCIPGRFSNCPDNLRDVFQVKVDKNRKLGELGLFHIRFDMTTGRFV